jgi:4-azaleucine resistance transporter AzlC
MTAIFVVIFVEHIVKENDHIPTFLGLILPIGALVLLGPDRFMIPAMAAILAALTLLRKPLERRHAV